MIRILWAHRLVFATVTSIVLCIGFTLHFLLHPPVHSFRLPEGINFAVWPSDQMIILRWAFLILALLLASTALFLCMSAVKREHDPQAAPWTMRHLAVLTPLSLLPLACIPLFIADKIPPAFSTNMPLFIIIASLSLFLTRLLSPLLDSKSVNEGGPSLWALGIFLLALAGHAYGGYHFSTTIGEHVGDEGHYLIQAQSLYEDGNVDLKAQLLAQSGIDDPSQVSREHYHIARESKGDAWYSWHPFGLSLLLAPIWSLGLGARHVMLGLISGAGLSGLFLLCRRVGAGNIASLITVLFLGTSVFWSLYAFRSLPEVLGATLLIWIFWAVAAQRQRPWLTLCIAAACCIYLPFAHTRFIPLSLIGFGFYVLFGLLHWQRQAMGLLRLALFIVMCLSGFALYLTAQSAMFDGASSYPISQLLFSYPVGAWAIIASHRGLISHTPVFFWLVGAMFIWFWRDPDQRLFIFGLGATFLACLVTSGATIWYTGGSSVPARFLLVVLPLLLPSAAVLLGRVNMAARTWFFALCLFSTFLLVLVLAYLPWIGRGFILPLHALSSMPLLQDFFFPHASFEHGFASDMLWTAIYVCIGFILTFFVILAAKNKLSYLLIIFTVFFGYVANAHIQGPQFIFSQYLQALQVNETNVVKIHYDPKRTSVWKSEVDVFNTHSFTGTRSSDDGMRVRRAFSSQDESAMMAFGRNVHIFPGKFAVFFELNIQQCTHDCIAATLDVSTGSGLNILNKEDIVCDDSFKKVKIDIFTNKFILIEPRVYYHGCGDITLHRIYVQEVPI